MSKPVFDTAPPKQCNACKTKQAKKWYIDKFSGRIGFICINCYYSRYYNKNRQVLITKKREKYSQ